MQIKYVKNFVDSLPQIQPLLSYVPIWLQEGSLHNREDSLSDPGEETHIPGLIIVKIIFSKPHLEHESHEHYHEEEYCQDGVEYTSNEGQSRQQFVESPVVEGHPPATLYLIDSPKTPGLVDKVLR